MGTASRQRIPPRQRPVGPQPERLNAWLQERVQRLTELVLARDENGPRFRQQALFAYFGLIWLLAVLVERPLPDPGLLETLSAGLPPFVAFLLRPLAVVVLAVFHLEVLRHFVLPAIAIWFSLQSAAVYLDDLLEVKDQDAARRYLQNTLFGSGYELMEIRDGDVTDLSRHGTMFKIGGPGYLKIHLGNAALFERVGGASTICAATHLQFLQGFERLREVVDLRDQIRQPNDMLVYTRDGIAVRATDLQVAFRLWSGRQSRNRNNPYPLDKRAVRQVVYGKSVGAGGRSVLWTETAAGMAASAVARYIGSRLLKDLIEQKHKVGVPPAGQEQVVTSGQATPAAAVARGPLPDNTRRPLSLSFYDEDAARRLADAGVELIWIGVGTLDTPAGITEEWINAWQADIAARIRRSKTSQQDQQRAARARVLERMLTDISRWWSQNQTGLAFSARRGRSAGLPRAEAGADPLATERSFFFGAAPSEEPNPELDALRFFVLKLQEQRNGLDPSRLPANTDAVLAYLRQMANLNPKIIGGYGEPS